MPLTGCANFINYAPATCDMISGGISSLYIFDPVLFDFTQGAPVAGVIQPYTAITDLGTASKIYQVKFEKMSAQYTFDQKNDNGTAVGITHQVEFSVPRIDMKAAQWNKVVNAASYCCGVGVIIITNNQEILIMGEGSVNSSKLIPEFYVYQDGTKGATGKKGTDKNSVDVILKSCEYSRMLIQYNGTLASILALVAP